MENGMDWIMDIVYTDYVFIFGNILSDNTAVFIIQCKYRRIH